MLERAYGIIEREMAKTGSSFSSCERILYFACLKRLKLHRAATGLREPAAGHALDCALWCHPHTESTTTSSNKVDRQLGEKLYWVITLLKKGPVGGAYAMVALRMRGSRTTFILRILFEVSATKSGQRPRSTKCRISNFSRISQVDASLYDPSRSKVHPGQGRAGGDEQGPAERTHGGGRMEYEQNDIESVSKESADLWTVIIGFIRTAARGPRGFRFRKNVSSSQNRKNSKKSANLVDLRSWMRWRP